MDDPRPLLSTEEFLEASGITRRTLRTWVKKGLLFPAFEDDAKWYKYWSYDQIRQIKLIKAMQVAGSSLDEIKEALASPDLDSVLLAKAGAAENMRNGRRRLKALVHFEQSLDDSKLVGEQDGYYLRYVPLRWMAMIPLLPHVAKQPTERDLVTSHIHLRRLSEVVGWASTQLYGYLIDVNEKHSQGIRYAFLELASPPMPSPTGSHLVDGGCYKQLSSREAKVGGKCQDCSRFGRSPSQSDRDYWANQETLHGSSLWTHSKLIKDFQTPYVRGIWARYTREMISGSQAEERTAELKRQEGAYIFQPHQMPMELPLPLGLSAAAFPAGVYLCKQYPVGDAERSFEEFSETTSRIPFSPEPLESFLRRKDQGEGTYRPKSPNGGPHPEPYSNSRMVGNMTMKGWFCPIEENRIPNLSLPREMALFHDDGASVISSVVPEEDGARTRRCEMQVYVGCDVEPWFANAS